jgi:hypothetical protein
MEGLYRIENKRLHLFSQRVTVNEETTGPGWKKNPTPRRKDAKKTKTASDAVGYGLLPFGLASAVVLIFDWWNPWFRICDCADLFPESDVAVQLPAG